MTGVYEKILALLLATACSSPDLGDANFACVDDSDCNGGRICGTLDRQKTCVFADESAIRIGLSAPFQGPSKDLGIEMRRGIMACFSRVNREGGVFGRPLELESLNDNYDPEVARLNMLELLDIQQEVSHPDQPDTKGDNSVFAFVGNVGTPTMLVTAPLATKNETVFFAPFTGSQKYLRDGTNSPYVYNVRAGYYDETEAIVDYMATYRSPRIIRSAASYERLLVFAQDDSYGDAGYDGFVGAYDRNIAALPNRDSRDPAASVRRVSYQREDLDSVDQAVDDTQVFLAGVLEDSAPESASVGILMVDTYLPGSKLIRATKDWINEDVDRATRLDVLFIHVSFVGSDALARALTDPPSTYADVRDASGQTSLSYAQGVMVTQVVPYYLSQAAGVKQYRDDVSAFDNGTYSFTSLEGYVSASLFVEALRRNGRDIDTERLLSTLDNDMAGVDLGIGTLLSFSSIRHQASSTVWGSEIQADGTFTLPFSWNPLDRIIPGSE